MRKWCLIVLFFPLMAQAEFLEEWVPKTHIVKEGETLRLIARQHFGVKYGVFCLQEQLQLKDPNDLKPGQQLIFVAPKVRSDELQQYMNVNLECSPGRVVINGELVYPLHDKPKPETLTQTEDVPKKIEEPKEPKTWPQFSRILLGSGVTFFHIKQEVEPNLGDVTYDSLHFLDLNFSAQWTFWGPLTLDFKTISTPGHVPQTNLSDEANFRWNQVSLGVLYELEPLRKKWQENSWLYSFLQGGFISSQFPYVASSSTNLAVYSKDYTSAYFGAEVLLKYEEKWWMLMQISGTTPLGQVSSSFGLQGALEIFRRVSDHWWVGVNWHGRTTEVEFTEYLSSTNMEFTTEVFHSTLDFAIQRTF